MKFIEVETSTGHRAIISVTDIIAIYEKGLESCAIQTSNGTIFYDYGMSAKELAKKIALL